MILTVSETVDVPSVNEAVTIAKVSKLLSSAVIVFALVSTRTGPVVTWILLVSVTSSVVSSLKVAITVYAVLCCILRARSGVSLELVTIISREERSGDSILNDSVLLTVPELQDDGVQLTVSSALPLLIVLNWLSSVTLMALLVEVILSDGRSSLAPSVKYI